MSGDAFIAGRARERLCAIVDLASPSAIFEHSVPFSQVDSCPSGLPTETPKKRAGSVLSDRRGRGLVRGLRFPRQREEAPPGTQETLVAPCDEQGRPTCIFRERKESAGSLNWIASKSRRRSHRSRRLAEGWLDSTLSSTEDRRAMRCPWDAPGSVLCCGDRGSLAGDLDDWAPRPTFENRKPRGSHRALTDRCDDT